MFNNKINIEDIEFQDIEAIENQHIEAIENQPIEAIENQPIELIMVYRRKKYKIVLILICCFVAILYYTSRK
jgi:hypothetical protein